MPDRLLMCPPDYFEVVYEINPWMSVRRQADQKRAMKQWQDYHSVLTGELGVKVEVIDPVKNLPDMVFTANAGLVYKRTFILSNFRHKERAGEEPYFEKWFRKQGYLVKKIEEPFSFEGEGDALFLNNEIYSGYHFRSDVEAHDRVSGILKTPYFALQLRDKRFYHLDTCFAPLKQDCAMAFIDAFEPYAQMVLHETISDLIEVPEDEAVKFACNAAVLGEKIVMPADCPKTAAALKSRGFGVHALEFGEFIKAGGAAKCLVLNL